MIKRYKYIIAFVLGCITAIGIGKLVGMSGSETSIDAWFLKLNIEGQDVGDRMDLFIRAFSDRYAPEAFSGVGYLIGHGLLEEIIKFVVFLILFSLIKPTSIREIVFLGITMGLGFATAETIAFYSASPLNYVMSFVLRALGHGLTNGVIALLFGFGYFTQMRWIDDGAKKGIFRWLVRYQEGSLQILLALLGVVLAALIHAGINIYAALGVEGIGIGIMAFAWLILIYFLIRPDSRRQYGVIIREVDLLQQITEAERDLKALEKIDSESEIPIFRKRLLRNLPLLSLKKKRNSSTRK